MKFLLLLDRSSCCCDGRTDIGSPNWSTSTHIRYIVSQKVSAEVIRINCSSWSILASSGLLSKPTNKLG